MRNNLVAMRGQNAKRTSKKLKEAAEKLKTYTESVQVLENGARFYRLRPGLAFGAETVESLAWKRLPRL